MNFTLENIKKQYSLKTVLNGVSAEFCGGRIYALLGENGAGKSTLASIISGAIRPDSGRILINGIETEFKNQREAITAGIICVQQRPLLAQELTLFQNIILGTEYAPGSSRLKGKYPAGKIESIKDIWAPWLNLKAEVWQTGGDSRFFAALISALLRDPQILILDEPSALLDSRESTGLYENLRKFVQSGKTVIIITHDTAAAEKYADSIIMMREGSICTEYGCGNSSEKKHRTADGIPNPVRRKQDFQKVIKFSNLTAKPENRPAIFDISFTAEYGHITLIQGVKGSGFYTLENVITGMETAACSGTFLVHSEKGDYSINLSTGHFTAANLRYRQKAAILSSDRNFRASNPSLTVGELLTAMYTGSSPKEYARMLIKKAGLSVSPEEPVSSLSGGMLQRLLLRRELEPDPELIIMCEPLQGLDTKAADDICRLLSEAAQKGKAVIVLSAAGFPEEICSSIYRMESGRIFTVKGPKP